MNHVIWQEGRKAGKKKKKIIKKYHYLASLISFDTSSETIIHHQVWSCICLSVCVYNCPDMEQEYLKGSFESTIQKNKTK